MNLVVKDGNVISQGGGLIGVNVGGPTPSGKITINDTSEVDVTDYATAQVNTTNLTSANIITGKSILGVNGSAVVPSGSQNITANGTYDITSKASVVVNVGSSGTVIQYNPTITQIKSSSSMKATNCSITVEETGTYKCSWVAWSYATSSSQYKTRLYKGSTAIGSSHGTYVYSGTGPFVFTENNIQLNAGDVVTVYVQTRSGSSYYTTAGMLVIEKTS